MVVAWLEVSFLGLRMASTSEGLEHLKEDVRRKLLELDVTELAHVCGELALTIPDGKATKKSAVYNLIAMHLMSQEEEDDNEEGKAVFERCDAVLNQILEAKSEAIRSGKQKQNSDTAGNSAIGVKDDAVETVEVKSTAPGDGPFNGRLGDSAPVVQNGGAIPRAARSGQPQQQQHVQPGLVHKLRDFRITGGVVSADENALDLTDVQFQMKEGLDAGYTPREVKGAVIKAMKGGSEMRRYFGRNLDKFKDDEFMENLELWYTKKESSELVDAMVESVQGPKETEKKYVMRMFDMRDQIMEVTETEDEPLAYSYVQKKMLRAISVGLRRDVIRLQLINVLNAPDVSDVKILKELKGITTRDVENRSKMEKSGGKASVNALQDHSGGSTGSHNNNNNNYNNNNNNNNNNREVFHKPESENAIARIEQQLGQLSVTMCDMAKGKSEVEERLKRLEDRLLAGGGAGGAGSARRDFPRCDACAPARLHCTHCKNCGESGHKYKDCPKPKNS